MNFLLPTFLYIAYIQIDKMYVRELAFFMIIILAKELPQFGYHLRLVISFGSTEDYTKIIIIFFNLLTFFSTGKIGEKAAWRSVFLTI